MGVSRPAGRGCEREGDVGQSGVIEPSTDAQKDDHGSRQQEGNRQGRPRFHSGCVKYVVREESGELINADRVHGVESGE